MVKALCQRILQGDAAVNDGTQCGGRGLSLPAVCVMIGIRTRKAEAVL